MKPLREYTSVAALEILVSGVLDNNCWGCPENGFVGIFLGMTHASHQGYLERKEREKGVWGRLWWCPAHTLIFTSPISALSAYLHWPTLHPKMWSQSKFHSKPFQFAKWKAHDHSKEEPGTLSAYIYHHYTQKVHWISEGHNSGTAWSTVSYLRAFLRHVKWQIYSEKVEGFVLNRKCNNI